MCSKEWTKPKAWRRPGSGSTLRRTAREEARGGARSRSEASSPLLNSVPSGKSTSRRIAAEGASSTDAEAELPRDGPEPPSREHDAEAAPAGRDPGIPVEVGDASGGGGCGLSAGARRLWRRFLVGRGVGAIEEERRWGLAPGDLKCRWEEGNGSASSG